MLLEQLKEVDIVKSMAKMEYHYGLKVRIYPSDKQKQIIKLNSDASRFIYNEMVAINKELWQLKQVKLPIDTVQSRIKQLELRQNMLGQVQNVGVN